MTIAALLAAMFTVMVGTIMLADVNAPNAAAPPRRLLTGHIVVALIALIVVAAAAAIASAAVAWVGGALLLLTATFGLTAFRHTLRAPREAKRPGRGVLIVHGAGALLTLALAIAAAITVR